MTDFNQDAPQAIGETTKGSGFFRYGAVLPLAAVATFGLMASMAALVATEFQPQDVTQTASFEINPKVEDIPEPIERVKPTPSKVVQIPPRPEPLDIKKEAVDKPAPTELEGKKIILKPGKLEINLGPDLGAIDKDPTPLVRIPPVFPNRFLQGDVSGYCRVSFDVSPTGAPFNVTVTLCTSRELKSPTEKSVRRWKYAPKMQNGRAVARSGLETTIRFDLQDKRGDVLPVPSGF